MTLLHTDLPVSSVELRFYDPAARGKDTNHLGFHPDNIKAFVKSKYFNPFLTDALKQLEQAARDMLEQPSYSWWTPPVGYEPKIVCVTFCNKGRHRSISSCEVLQHVLSENFNIQVCGVQPGSIQRFHIRLNNLNTSCVYIVSKFHMAFAKSFIYINMCSNGKMRQHLGRYQWNFGTCRRCNECAVSREDASVRASYAWASRVCNTWMRNHRG